MSQAALGLTYPKWIEAGSSMYFLFYVMINLVMANSAIARTILK
jgi:hypothetical protein